jgi:nucleoside-diphosphate-sugar epimerase
VTGGAGYLGAVMVPTLLAAGHCVTVVDNFMFRQNSLSLLCADSRFTIVKGDIRDPDLMRDLIRRADVVVPLAALVGAPLCQRDPVTAASVNLDAPRAMLAAMSPAQRLILPVTNSGYGIGESSVICNETSPMRPLSNYARQKVEIEKAALDRGNAISFRLATVFGMSPRMRLDLLVNDFVYRAVTDRFVVLFEGHFRRNYIHVRDVTGVFMHGLVHFDTMVNEAYNVGLSNANLSKIELCERIRLHVPQFLYMASPIGEDPDKRDYIVSTDKIERSGFVPAHSLDSGIVELIKGCTMLQNKVYSNV